MKKTYYFIIVLISTFILSSCSDKYEDSIKTFIQSNNTTQLDLALKIKDTKELRTITVADSVGYLTKRNDLGKETLIVELEETINKYQEIVVKGVDGKKLSKTLSEAYLAEIEKSKIQIDSIKAIPSTPIAEYEGRKASDVLVVIVEAVYEIENPNKEILTSNFILSPDGKTCYGVTDNVNMLPEK